MLLVFEVEGHRWSVSPIWALKFYDLVLPWLRTAASKVCKIGSLGKILNFTRTSLYAFFHDTFLPQRVTIYSDLSEKGLVCACFPSVMIQRNLFTLKSFPVGTINLYGYPLSKSFFCSLPMVIEYRMHLISTVCIFRTTEEKLCPRRFPARYVRISWFVNSCFLSLWKAHSLQALGKGLLHSALLRCGTLGKTAHCLFCGDWQQSSLGWLKAKWKNTSWVIFPLPTLTNQCVNV